MFTTAASRRALTSALALTLALAFALPAGAQGFRRRNPVDAGQGAFQVGIMTLDLSELNTALAAASFPRFKNQFLTLGGSGYGVRGRWLIGGEGTALIGTDQSTASGLFTLSANGGFGMFRIGYNLSTSQSFDLFPTVGFGAGGVGVVIRGRSAPTFTDVLTTPARSSSLSSGGFVLGAGVTSNLRIRFAEEQADSTEGGLLVGVSVGYVLQPASSSWKLDQTNSVAGGPAFKLQGLYVRCSLGGWARTPRKK